MTSEPTADVCVLTAERGECRAILGVFASADAAREYLEKRHLGANHYARLLDVRSVGSEDVEHWLSPTTRVEYIIRACPCSWCSGRGIMEQADASGGWDEACRFCEGTGKETIEGRALYMQEVGTDAP